MADWRTQSPIKREKQWQKKGLSPFLYSEVIHYLSLEHSCLCEIEQEKEICLALKYIGHISQGIRENLDSGLLKYSEELEGILVTYKRIQCLQNSGNIIDDRPYLFLNVKVEYIVFKPEIGKKLRGTVNKVGHGHLGCLVHNCFNSSIHKLNSHQNMKKKVKKIIDSIDIGTEVIFRVTRLDISNDILSIKGIIDPEDYEKIRNPGNKAVDNSRTQDDLLIDGAWMHDKSNKNQEDDSGLVADYMSSDSARHAKKKKRKRALSSDHTEEDTTNFGGNNTQNDIKKKKRKHYHTPEKNTEMKKGKTVTNEHLNNSHADSLSLLQNRSLQIKLEKLDSPKKNKKKQR